MCNLSGASVYWTDTSMDHSLHHVFEDSILNSSLEEKLVSYEFHYEHLFPPSFKIFLTSRRLRNCCVTYILSLRTLFSNNLIRSQKNCENHKINVYKIDYDVVTKEEEPFFSCLDLWARSIFTIVNNLL